MPRPHRIAGVSAEDDGAARYRIKLYKAVTQMTGDVNQEQQDDEVLRLRRRKAEVVAENATRHAR